MAAIRVVLGKAESLLEGESMKFSFESADGEHEGFILRHRDRLYAYRNECRHIPMTMDWVENRFLSRDRRYIQCATHGALYEIETGLCVDGPPVGETLRCLSVEVEDGQIVVTILQ